MGFTYQDIEGREFTTLDEVIDFVGDEERRVQRLPAAALLTRGAEFYGDHSFGIPGEGLQFNEEGLRALCSVLGVPLTVIESIERHELATELLNDLLARHDVQEELAQREFVWDRDSEIILGIVSTTYRFYSNRELIDDMRGFLVGAENGNGRLRFQSAFSANTRLRLRVLKEFEHGEVFGYGGDGSDKSVLGLQVANSMTGDTAVSIRFYVERLLCANGLIAPVSHTENRVFHSGRQENFAGRLDTKVRSVLSGANGMLKMLGDLSDLAFDPKALARARYAPNILDVIPEYRAKLKSAGTGLTFKKDVPSNERKLRREERMIEAVPAELAVGHSARVFESNWRDNATMFDFVNIFTEKAKELSVPQRVEAEERAGMLADKIAKNRSKFPPLCSRKLFY